MIVLTIFGRIRRRLFEEGNVLKYLAYGFGEVVLIIIGILLAIEISEWNDERNHRLEQIALMERLVRAVETDRQFPIAGLLSNVTQTIDTISLIEQDAKVGGISEHRGYVQIMNSSVPQSIVAAEFGELQRDIADKEIAAKVGSYLAIFDSNAEFYDVRTREVLLQLSHQINQILDPRFPDGYRQIQGAFDESKFMEKYQTDPEFRGTIYRLYLNSRSTYSHFKFVDNFAEELITLVEEKLAEE